jgi:hypothetical protein
MCIEIYCREQPIKILFEQEVIQFSDPFTFTARYLLLIKNAGFVPISQLQLLYPRYLLSSERFVSPDDNKPRLRFHFDNIVCVPEPPRAGSGFDHVLIMDGHEASIGLADPNLPLSDRNGLTGQWCHESGKFRLPHGSVVEHHGGMFDRTCRRHRFSAWELALPHAIPSNGSQWFQFEIGITDAGTSLPCRVKREPIVFHEFASPIDVRRTIVELVQTDLREAHYQYNSAGDDQTKRQLSARSIHGLEALIDDFGLDRLRQVDIEYYELTIEAGDPDSQYVGYCIPQGDIRLRPGSPRVEPVFDEGGTTPKFWQPVYYWKSGSILEPAHPWKNTGFTIRLGLTCSPDYGDRVREMASQQFCEYNPKSPYTALLRNPQPPSSVTSS